MLGVHCFVKCGRGQWRSATTGHGHSAAAQRRRITRQPYSARNHGVQPKGSLKSATALIAAGVAAMGLEKSRFFLLH